jgi:diacylglycerol kinase (ATP)
MSKRIVVIANPISGSVELTGLLRRIARQARVEGMEFDIYETEEQGHGADLARTHTGSADALVIAGGDGTVREVVTGSLNSQTPLAVFPSGTENLFAQQIGARRSTQCLLDTLRRGQRRTLDVGRMNEAHFLVVSGIGFDAEAVQRLMRSRSGHITHLSYFWPIWRTFWEYRFPRMQVVADGEEIFDDSGLVFVGNMPRYAVGLHLLRDAAADDGYLDLCIYPCRWQGKLLVHAANAFLRRHVGRAGVIYRKCSRISVASSETVLVEMDGDLAGVLPANYAISPRAVTFLFPPA